MKKLLICTFYTSNLEYGNLSQEINKKYCDDFDIDFFSETNDEIINEKREGRSFTWYKVQLLLDLLKKNEYEYVMYMDADAVFVRNNYNIIEIIDKNNEYDFICSADFGPDIINGGILIFKNSEWSINFLERVWDSANYISRGKYKVEPWQDQTIFSAFMLINKEDRRKTKIMSHYDDNAINDHSLRPNKTLIYHDLSKIRIAELHKLSTQNYDITTELNLSCTSDRHVSHGYGFFYKEHLEHNIIQNEEFKILDIGGDNGVLFDIFSKYYPNIKYYNISPSLYENKNENINIINLSSIDEENLSKFVNNSQDEYDIIISDFRHSCEMRDLIFSLFFEKVKKGGVFVVEDLQTDLEISIPEKNQQYGWGDPNKKSMTDLINQFNIDFSFDSDYYDFKNLNEMIDRAKIHKLLPFPSLLGLIYKK